LFDVPRKKNGRITNYAWHGKERDVFNGRFQRKNEHAATKMSPTSYTVSSKELLIGQKKVIKLPKLFVKPSQIIDGGFGVYAAEMIPKNKWITIYGGKYLTAVEAAERTHQTHIRTISSQFLCVDSLCTVENGFTLEGLVQNHMVGGFVNSSENTNFKQNCKYEKREQCCTGFPRIDKDSTIQSLDHIMMKTIRNIKRGEELFSKYGRGHSLTYCQSPSNTGMDTKARIPDTQAMTGALPPGEGERSVSTRTRTKGKNIHGLIWMHVCLHSHTQTFTHTHTFSHTHTHIHRLESRKSNRKSLNPAAAAAVDCIDMDAPAHVGSKARRPCNDCRQKKTKCFCGAADAILSPPLPGSGHTLLGTGGYLCAGALGGAANATAAVMQDAVRYRERKGLRMRSRR
jgi:hypothetical protein